MGEIFSRPQPVRPLIFSGERVTSAVGGQTEFEHLHRYVVARHFCRGKDVLDLASGEGYGSALIAQVARSVVGVDSAAEAIEHAEANYSTDRLRFVRGSATSIPLRDRCMDVVVSFETIEHIERQETFLAEVRRVLCPGGLLIISTPDRDNYSPAETAANPYHVLELTRDEFVALLYRDFKHVACWWQRPMHGSVLMPGPEAAIAGETLSFERRGPSHFEGSTGYARPQYLIAVCSDAALPPLPISVYIETSQLHVHERAMERAHAAEEACRETTERGKEAVQRAHAAEEACRGANQRAETAEAVVATLEAVARAAESRAAAAEAAGHAAESRAAAAEVVSREAQGQAAAARMIGERERAEAERLRQEIETRDRMIAAVLASTSWRVTAPLRAIRTLFRVSA